MIAWFRVNYTHLTVRRAIACKKRTQFACCDSKLEWTTSSSLMLDARHFLVIVKTLAFDLLIGSLFESAQWHISFAEIFSESLSSSNHQHRGVLVNWHAVVDRWWIVWRILGLKYFPEEFHVSLAPYLTPFHSGELLASFHSNKTDTI